MAIGSLAVAKKQEHGEGSVYRRASDGL